MQGQNRKRARSVSRPKKMGRVMRIPKSLSAINRQSVMTVMGAAGNISINNNTGWNAVGSTLSVVCQQDRIQYSISGGAFVTLGAAFVNAVPFATIYDQFRINKMEVTIMYSDNSSAISGSLALPIVYGVVDFDDVNTITNASQALQYASCKIMQLGNSSGTDGGKQKIVVNKPAVRQSVDTTNIAFGTVASGVIAHSPWLNTDVTNVEHNGVKLFIDTVTSSNSTVGVVTIAVRCFHEYKFSK